MFDPLAPYFNVDVKFHAGSEMDDQNHHEVHINIEIGGEGVKEKTEVNFAWCWRAAPFFQAFQLHTWAHACAPVSLYMLPYTRGAVETDAGLFPSTD